MFYVWHFTLPSLEAWNAMGPMQLYKCIMKGPPIFALEICYKGRAVRRLGNTYSDADP